LKLLKINILSYNNGFKKIAINFSKVLSNRYFECKIGANFETFSSECFFDSAMVKL